MNKTALVTGGAKGIGRATVIALSKLGFNVAINYNTSESEAAALAASLSPSLENVAAFQADVSDFAAVCEMTAKIEKRFSPISVLINNAGLASQKLFTDTSEAELDRLYAVNLKAAFNTCKAVLPSMIREKYGKIINISSIWGITGASCEVAYSAMKAGLIGFTKALAKEVGPSNINVNCVAPGVIMTDMCKGLSSDTLEALKEETPLMRLGTPEDIANAVAFLISDSAAFITGQVLSPNGGMLV